MFYRRKIILALLQAFDGKLEKIRLQKLLFLFSQKQEQSSYDFIPYKYGCYSYSASADLRVMVKKGFLLDNANFYTKEDNINYIKMLKASDCKILEETERSYFSMSSNALMKYTYINFPYWAIKSEVAEKILSKVAFAKVKQKDPKIDKTVLYTIGYEGISLEEYLNRLLKNGVKLLIDVRQNPLSMKFGFSKTLLTRYCESVGINYMHFPEVGIHGDQRRELKTQNDYDKLFQQYKNENLINTKETQVKILLLLKEYKRVALTCFEANICQCHRKPLAESIESLGEFSYDLMHI